MKKNTRITIIVSLCIMIAAIGIYFLLHAFQTGSSSETIYVQKYPLLLVPPIQKIAIPVL